MTPSVSIITFTRHFRDRRTEVFKVVKIPIVALWVMRPPSLLERYKRVGGTECSIYI